MKKTILLLVVIALAGCTRQEQQELEEVGAYRADPEKVPRDVALYSSEPLLAAIFDASETGYSMQVFRATGAPTSNIDLDRAVVIKALDRQGRELHSVSVANPRDVQTTGARKPERAVLPVASFTVFFRDPDTIHSLEVTVLKGANTGFKQSFNVEPDELRQLKQN